MIEPTAKIVKKVKAVHPNVPIIGFPAAAHRSARNTWRRTGVDALGCDTAAPLKTIAAARNELTVQGNLDPLLLLAGGDALEHGVKSTLAALSPKPYVFNLGHGILPETPIENVKRLIELVRSRGLALNLVRSKSPGSQHFKESSRKRAKRVSAI